MKRFWTKVDKWGPDDCWPWLAGTNAKGYGRLMVHGKAMRAHRLSWCLAFGEIPNGLHVCHTCDAPSCVNPAHMFLGSNQANVDDKVSKGRQARVTGDSHGRRTRPQCTARGDRHGRRRVTAQCAESVRSLRKLARLPYESIGRIYGISAVSARNICIGRTWKNQ